MMFTSIIKDINNGVSNSVTLIALQIKQYDYQLDSVMAAHLLKSAHNSYLLTLAHGSLLLELHLSWRTDGDFTYLHITDAYNYIISCFFPYAYCHTNKCCCTSFLCRYMMHIHTQLRNSVSINSSCVGAVTKLQAMAWLETIPSLPHLMVQLLVH